MFSASVGLEKEGSVDLVWVYSCMCVCLKLSLAKVSPLTQCALLPPANFRMHHLLIVGACKGFIALLTIRCPGVMKQIYVYEFVRDGELNWGR